MFLLDHHCALMHSLVIPTTYIALYPGSSPDKWESGGEPGYEAIPAYLTLIYQHQFERVQSQQPKFGTVSGCCNIHIKFTICAAKSTHLDVQPQ